MKNQELFNKTISILVKAYIEDTLIHSNCHACAVGNLVAANMGYSYKANPVLPFERDWPVIWGHEENYSTLSTWYGVLRNRSESERGEIEINSTGYSKKELSLIEAAFESVDDCETKEKMMFDGLMAVCDSLMTIHEANESEIKEAKELFIQCY